jgi:hypothetical protein
VATFLKLHTSRPYVGEASADAVVATDSVSANIDGDYGDADLGQGGGRWRSGCEAHRLARPAREAAQLIDRGYAENELETGLSPSSADEEPIGDEGDKRHEHDRP